MFAEMWSKVRPLLVPVALLAAFVWSLWFANSLWLFSAGLLLAVGGMRVSEQSREDHLFERLVRNYDRR